MFETVRGVATRPARTLTFVATVLCCSMIGGAGARGEALDDGPLTDPALTIVAERAEITLDGDLAEGTAKRLRAVLRANPSIRSLSLESDGGLVDEAEQIGDLVAAHGLVTIARSRCVSACTLAFVRGRERLAQSGVKLGFHAPWVLGGGTEPVSSDDERQAYVAAGVAEEFVAEALAVPAETVWFPDGERLLKANVVTVILAPTELSARLATLAAPKRLAAASE